MLGNKNPMNDVHRYGKNAPYYGKHHSDEVKQKMRDAKIGKKFSREHSNKITQQYKWITPNNEIKFMTRQNAAKWHPDWILVNEN